MYPPVIKLSLGLDQITLYLQMFISELNVGKTLTDFRVITDTV